jgi:uncharacterized protein YbcV (DUF1398 family)
MLTLEQIEEANSKVESGADFPRLVQKLIALGVKSSEFYVSDGRAEYFGDDGFKVESIGKYSPLSVADASDDAKFKDYLKIHQQGKTDYPTFCRHSAETGVEKWKLDFDEMTCTYFDKAGNELLTEQIPTV